MLSYVQPVRYNDTHLESSMNTQPAESERLSKEHFSTWLAHRQPYLTQEWLFEPNGFKTAPDFHLRLDGVTYAVEVARVQSLQRVGDLVVSESNWTGSFERVRRRLLNEHKATGTLRGAYHFMVEALLPHFRKNEAKLIQQLSQYIHDTQEVPTAPDQEVVVAGTRVGIIAKLHNRAEYIALSGFGRSWPDDSFCAIVQSEVLDKMHKLRQEKLPCILLLADWYLMAPPYIWDACARDAGGYEFFHSVFVITHTEHDYMLHSLNPDWPAVEKDSYFWDQIDPDAISHAED